MRRGLIVAAVVLLLLAGGGYMGVQYGKKYIAERVMDEVIEQVLRDEEMRRLLDDPEVRRALREAVTEEDLERLRSVVGTEPGSGKSGDAAGGSNSGAGVGPGGGTWPVTSVEEAEALVLENFSIGEIRRYAAMAGDGLTEEEKIRIRDEALSRFTEEEWRALQWIALMEAEKRTNE